MEAKLKYYTDFAKAKRKAKNKENFASFFFYGFMLVYAMTANIPNAFSFIGLTSQIGHILGISILVISFLTYCFYRSKTLNFRGTNYIINFLNAKRASVLSVDEDNNHDYILWFERNSGAFSLALAAS